MVGERVCTAVCMEVTSRVSGEGTVIDDSPKDGSTNTPTDLMKVGNACIVAHDGSSHDMPCVYVLFKHRTFGTTFTLLNSNTNNSNIHISGVSDSAVSVHPAHL